MYQVMTLRKMRNSPPRTSSRALTSPMEPPVRPTSISGRSYIWERPSRLFSWSRAMGVG